MKVVVIGAGIGGLASALDLAASGVDVMLVERHEQPGGKMREKQAGDFAIDSGPTVFTMRWVFEDLFDLAGTSLAAELDLARATELARHFWQDGSRLDLYPDIDSSVAAIDELAGAGDAEAYRNFAKRSERIFETLDLPFMRAEKPSMFGLPFAVGLTRLHRLIETRPWRTLWEELDATFDDSRLRQLFARYATYCGSSPFDAPATLMLIAHAERAGVWMVRGGMQRFAEALAGAAEKTGAELRFGDGVASIDIQNDCVCGVVLDSGKRLDADAVVFNGDANALSEGLLGEDATHAVPDRRRETRSLSALTVSASVRTTDFPLGYHNVFFGSDYPTEFSSIFEQQTVCNDPTVYVCAQDRIEGLPESETERLFFLINAPPRAHSPREREQLVERLFGVLLRHGFVPELGDAVVTDPTEFGERFPGSAGAIYGWPTHGMDGTFKRSGSRSHINGLYLAGGSVHPGPGIPMVALSGRIAANALREDAKR